MPLETYMKAIMSGERQSFDGTLARMALWPLSYLYSQVMTARNRSYDISSDKICKVSRPVISIGNITAGGTGKTPFVHLVCRFYQEHGLKPVVLMRGYKAKNTKESQIVSDGKNLRLSVIESGDEANLLATSLPGVGVVIGSSRVASAKLAINVLEADVILLDDGFQHRRIARDLDIVLLDMTNPFGYEYVLPRGLLREPLRGLQRASLIVLTKCDQVPPEKIREIKKRVKTLCPQTPILVSVHTPQSLRPLVMQETKGRGILCSQEVGPLLAVSAIGNPQSFMTTLQQGGYSVVEQLVYRDHHEYTVADVATIVEKAFQCGANGVVMTEKDATKLQSLWQSTPLATKMPAYVLPIELTIQENRSLLDTMLGRFVK